MRKERHGLIGIGLAALTIAAILAVNYGLQPMPLREWLPRVVAAVAAVLVLLLLNMGWAGGIRALMRDAAARRNS